MIRLVRHRRAHRLRSCRGATLVEAAFATPLLLLLTFAIVDFASLFYVFLALESGVSQASRYGITGNQLTGQSREDSIRAELRRVTPTLTFADDAFTFSHLAPGSSTWAAGAGGPGDVMRVSVAYDWSLLTPIVRPFFTGGRIRLTAETAMMNERRFD